MNKKHIRILFYITLAFFLVLPNAVYAAWYNSNYQYCRKMTMVAGGDSSGVATTTTAGFALVATSTISTLAATSSSGSIFELNSYTLASTTPVDFAVTNGTDCNSDGGSLLDFYFEEYDKTTGKFVLWVEPTDISSTTAKSVLMYYGYANDTATDQSNQTGVWGASGEMAVYNLNEDPSGAAPQILDSTSNNVDLTTQGEMTTSDQVGAYINGGIDGDGVNDVATSSVASTPKPTSITISAWIRAPGTEDTTFVIVKDGGSSNSYGISVKDTGTAAGQGYRGLTRVGTTEYLSFINQTTWNRWDHVMYTYSSVSGDNNLYLNGAFVATKSTGGGNITYPTSGCNCLGLFGDATAGLKAAIVDDVRIYNQPLHAMDVLTIYNNTRSSVAFWTFGAEETETATATTASRIMRLFKGFTVKFVSGRIIIHQKQ